ncbi:hypothetical protein ACFLQU_00240 [Verrucomicrobiota bacterium]
MVEHHMHNGPDTHNATEQPCKTRSFWTALLVAVAFMAYGVFRGDVLEVYQDASSLCLSCFGIE